MSWQSSIIFHGIPCTILCSLHPSHKHTQMHCGTVVALHMTSEDAWVPLHLHAFTCGCMCCITTTVLYSMWNTHIWPIIAFISVIQLHTDHPSSMTGIERVQKLYYQLSSPPFPLYCSMSITLLTVIPINSTCIFENGFVQDGEVALSHDNTGHLVLQEI